MRLKVKVTLLGANISHLKGTFEDHVPFPQVGYVSSLEGTVILVVFLKWLLSNRIGTAKNKSITLPKTNIAPGKMVVGRLLSFWGGLFLVAMLVSGRVYKLYHLGRIDGSQLPLVLVYHGLYKQFSLP